MCSRLWRKTKWIGSVFRPMKRFPVGRNLASVFLFCFVLFVSSFFVVVVVERRCFVYMLLMISCLRRSSMLF